MRSRSSPIGRVNAVTAFEAVTMFKLFKRSVPAAAKAGSKPAPKPASRQAASLEKELAPPLPEESALPEVVEGNEHTDWALWEDSVSVMDSQMQGLTPAARIYERDKQTPSQLQDIDPFSRINKNSA